ncbi:hypothetical protein ACLKA6_015094, partial [Drosophila palustris]
MGWGSIVLKYVGWNKTAKSDVYRKRKIYNYQKRLNHSPSTTSINTSSSIIKGATKATQQIPQNKQQQQNVKNNATINKNCSKPLDKNITEESLRSGVDQTELQELNELGLILSTPRESKRASISNESTACICGGAHTDSCNCATEKAPKVQRCGSHNTQELSNSIAVESTTHTTQQLKSAEEATNEANSKNITATIPSKNEELLQNTTLASQVEDIAARNPSLKCYMDNGYLNYERLAKCLEARNQQQEEKQSQLMGLAIVVQFMSKQ